jgi:hypothetical protein
MKHKVCKCAFVCFAGDNGCKGQRKAGKIEGSKDEL